MKRIILALCVFSLFALNVTALSIDQITPDKDFLIYSSEPKAVADILETPQAELEQTVKDQNIKFLAVNKQNTKQIQLTENLTDFSSTVGNLTNLSDSSIKSLLPDITGIENIKGEIVLKDSQKYVNINLKDTKSGYILTQYFTVLDKKLYTLSFYTEQGESTDYIKTAFETAENIPDNITVSSNLNTVRIGSIIGTVIFGIAFVIILASVIKDFIKKSA